MLSRPTQCSSRPCSPGSIQEMGETFGNGLLQAAVGEDTVTAIHGMDTELPVWMLGVFL